MTTKEVEGLRREAETIVKGIVTWLSKIYAVITQPILSLTERKKEEKEDLWKLWNEMRQDQPSAYNNKEDDDTASLIKREGPGGGVAPGPKKMQYTSSNHSIAESIARMNAANVNIGNGYVTKPSATFELKDGKFDQAAAPSYSYNNNNYNYAEPAPTLSRPASQLRCVSLTRS